MRNFLDIAPAGWQRSRYRPIPTRGPSHGTDPGFRRESPKTESDVRNLSYNINYNPGRSLVLKIRILTLAMAVCIQMPLVSVGNTQQSCLTPRMDSLIPVFNPSATEGDNVVFQFNLEGSYQDEVKFRYKSANGSAVEHYDYRPKEGVLTFPPGNTSQSVTVETFDDSDTSQEYFFMVITEYEKPSEGQEFCHEPIWTHRSIPAYIYAKPSFLYDPPSVTPGTSSNICNENSTQSC